MLNLIGSHDTSRFLYEAGENIESLKMAVFFQMTSIGIPMVYYGDELGLTGGNDPDSRRTIDFKNGNKELFNYYKKLISIRKNSAALKYGEFKTIYASDNVYAYKRFTTDENIINIFNNNAAKKSIVLNIAGTKVMDLYNNTNYYLEANKLIINMSPFQKCILKLE
ncbi:alpha-amylase family glycosyl hydrolase [Clostridium sp. DMHC 10]|nr:alpha-amylase family glycosyl hydrolase [Clostridium sp. DMHC 10]